MLAQQHFYGAKFLPIRIRRVPIHWDEVRSPKDKTIRGRNTTRIPGTILAGRFVIVRRCDCDLPATGKSLHLCRSTGTGRVFELVTIFHRKPINRD